MLPFDAVERIVVLTGVVNTGLKVWKEQQIPNLSEYVVETLVSSLREPFRVWSARYTILHETLSNGHMFEHWDLLLQ